MTALAERAVACTGIAVASGLPKWRWLTGMCSLDGWMVYDVGDGFAATDVIDIVCVDTGALDSMYTDSTGKRVEFDDAGSLALPDFSHKLTELGLLVLVRDAWGPTKTILINVNLAGAIVSIGDHRGWTHEFITDILTESLIIALEAAP